MFRNQLRILKKIVQPPNFHKVEVVLFKNKSVSQIQRFSTQSDNDRILNQIYKHTRKEFKNVSPNVWIDRINVLRTYSFLDIDCLDMIKKNPGILEIDLTKFKNSIKQWSCCGLAMDEFQTVIFEHPVLLEVEDEVIRKRIPQLRMLCGSQTLLTELLLNSPNVMLDCWFSVLAKVDYLIKVGRFSMSCIVESRALSKSLDFIKFRIDILKKCGFYKDLNHAYHKINKYDKSQHKNPSLSCILTLDEEYFSSEVAKISVEEYYVCYNLYMEEVNEDESSDDEEVNNYEKYRNYGKKSEKVQRHISQILK